MHDPISRRQAVGALAGLLATPLIPACFSERIAGPALSTVNTGGLTLIGAGDSHAAATNIKYRQATAEMIARILDHDPTAWAFNAGDLVQEGTVEEYQTCYEPTWGRFKDRTLFTLGNHDRKTDSTGAAYYEYTGAERYYARTFGSWRLYVLNSESARFGGADAAEQTAWLREDIAQHADNHIAAMWHIPMYSNICGHNGKAMTWPGKVGAWWQVLQDHGAEFVISGHAHRWERFKRLTRTGAATAQGLRQFVMGTGGGSKFPVQTMHQHCEKAVVERGVVQFDLLADRYEWRFTDINGVVRDSGIQMCRKIAA
jgi:predicted phosphodiesterase